MTGLARRSGLGHEDGMSDDDAPTEPLATGPASADRGPAAPDRRGREAAALKANLAKRKAWQRRRRETTRTPPDSHEKP